MPREDVMWMQEHDSAVEPEDHAPARPLDQCGACGGVGWLHACGRRVCRCPAPDEGPMARCAACMGTGVAKGAQR